MSQKQIPPRLAPGTLRAPAAIAKKKPPVVKAGTTTAKLNGPPPRTTTSRSVAPKTGTSSSVPVPQVSPRTVPSTPPRKPASSLPPVARKTPPDKPTGKKKKSGLFLIWSVLVHVVFILLAWFLVVQTISERKVTFNGKTTPPNPVRKEIEHKVQMAQKRESMSAPTQSKRVTTTAVSSVALPDLPATPDEENTPLSAIAGMGITGHGAGEGFGALSNARAFAGAQTVPFFGVQSGDGLRGLFYDLKRDNQDKPTGMDLDKYGDFLKRFTNGAWQINTVKHHDYPTALYAKFFFFPAIRDTEAGAAFHAPDAGPGMWVAHYKGTFSASEDGTYRLVGFGDNVLIVRISGALALDASDHGYTGHSREQVGEVRFPAKSGPTPIFFGPWLTLRKGETKPIDILVGDEGGIFCAGLFIQMQDQTYSQNAAGLPKLPLLFMGAPSPGEKAALGKYLPPESLAGPYFNSAKNPSDGFPH